MKIGINALFLVTGNGGGLERYLCGLLKGLEKVDRNNEYLLFTNKDCRGFFDLPGNFKELTSDVSAVFRPAKILWEQFVLPFQLKRERVDILLSPGNISPIASPCPTVTVIHDMIPFVRPEGFNKMELLSLKTLFYLTAKRSSKIITVSNASKNTMLNKFNVPENKIKVIYPGLDKHFRPVNTGREGIKKHRIEGRYILYVASSKPYKNIDGLMRAFKILKDRYNIEQRLVIIGLEGRMHSKLGELAKKQGIERDVIFTGFIPDSDLPLLYSAADAFVYPSLYEGFGFPVLEAMACGTPVAASNVTSLPEVVGDAGLLFDPNNIEEMAEKIFRIIENNGLRDELIRKGFEHVKGFSWEKAAEEVLSLLTMISKKGCA